MGAGSGSGGGRHDVVVGVDGSAEALRAVRWAAREARRRDVALRLVAAHEPVSEATAHRTSEHRFAEVLRREAADAVAAAAAAAEEAAPGVAVEDRVTAGQPVDVLRAESATARLLVLGDRGRGRLEGAIAGSVAVAMTTQARCPVVVVRGERSADVAGSGLPVVLGVDGSATSEAATEFAFAAAAARDVPLVAVHAWWDPVVGPVLARLVDVEAVESDERRLLAERLEGWRAKYPGVRVETVVSRDFPAHVLLRQATQAQLLVVGSRGRGELGGLVLGSVSNALVHRARCPVAVVRPDASGRV
jgi:nucleotide-binding universal stress UspA family protein